MEELQLYIIRYGLASNPQGHLCNLYVGPTSVKKEDLFKEFDKIKDSSSNTLLASPLEEVLEEKGFKRIDGWGFNVNEEGDITVSSNYNIYEFAK